MSQPIISLDRPNKVAAELPEIDAVPANSEQTIKPRRAAPAKVKIEPQPELLPTPPAYEKIVTIGARIPASLHQSIKLYCVAKSVEMQQFVQDALTNHLSKLQTK